MGASGRWSSLAIVTVVWKVRHRRRRDQDIRTGRRLLLLMSLPRGDWMRVAWLGGVLLYQPCDMWQSVVIFCQGLPYLPWEVCDSATCSRHQREKNERPKRRERERENEVNDGEWSSFLYFPSLSGSWNNLFFFLLSSSLASIFHTLHQNGCYCAVPCSDRNNNYHWNRHIIRICM